MVASTSSMSGAAEIQQKIGADLFLFAPPACVRFSYRASLIIKERTCLQLNCMLSG